MKKISALIFEFTIICRVCLISHVDKGRNEKQISKTVMDYKFPTLRTE